MGTIVTDPRTGMPVMFKGVPTRTATGWQETTASPPPPAVTASDTPSKTPAPLPVTPVVSTGEAAVILGLDPFSAREVIAAHDVAAVVGWRRSDIEALALKVPALFASGQLKRNPTP